MRISTVPTAVLLLSKGIVKYHLSILEPTGTTPVSVLVNINELPVINETNNWLISALVKDIKLVKAKHTSATGTDPPSNVILSVGKMPPLTHTSQ